MNSVDNHLKEFLPGPNRHAVLLDASAGLALGVLPGLENFSASVQPVLSWLDGLVCSPGQLRRLDNRTHSNASLLVRMDWTNTLRGEASPLPPETAFHVFILEAKDALELGASAMVMSFLLGYEEAIEAACLKATVQLALAGKDLGLPLVVEVCPSGPRVFLPSKAVELGASYALESGADVIAIPNPGLDSLKTIAAMVSVPWFLKPAFTEKTDSEWEEALDRGAAGLWLDHTWLAPSSLLKQLTDRLHEPPETTS